MCRFISPDSVNYLDSNLVTGFNLYAYCGNDPINKFDPNGNITISVILVIISAAVGAFVGIGTTLYNDAKDGVLFNENNLDYLYYGLTGAITGAIGGMVAKTGFICQLFVSLALGAASNISDGIYTGELNSSSNFLDYFLCGLEGAISSGVNLLLTTGATKLATKITYKNIIGTNKSNHHINQALKKAGITKTIGGDGIKKVLSAVEDLPSVQAVGYGVGAVYDLVVGVLF